MAASIDLGRLTAAGQDPTVPPHDDALGRLQALRLYLLQGSGGRRRLAYALSHGNQMVVLCERGIRTFETATRNTLDLSAVPVVQELTHLPVIVDPSHAVGVRRWVPALAHGALASGACGLMLEIHPEPGRALSDGPQALTFEMFEALMRRLA